MLTLCGFALALFLRSHDFPDYLCLLRHEGQMAVLCLINSRWERIIVWFVFFPLVVFFAGIWYYISKIES